MDRTAGGLVDIDYIVSKSDCQHKM